MGKIIDLSKTQLRRSIRETLSIAWPNNHHWKRTGKPAKISFMISREEALRSDSMKILDVALQNVAFHFNYCRMHNFLISVKFAPQENSASEYMSIILYIFPDARGPKGITECFLWMLGYIDSLFRVLKGSSLWYPEIFEPYETGEYLANLGLRVCLKGVHDHD